MARKLRVEFPGACYHAINRGNYRSNVFATPGAARSFQRCLFEACARFLWRLHAFIIMRNHFHLALETPEPNLSLGMKWLQGTWAVRFNRFRSEVGQRFQGRYKALHVERGEALARVTDYIHRARLNEELVAQSSVHARFELLGADRQAHIAARAELWEERLLALAVRSESN